MKKTGDQIELSAGDLSNHIACRHLTNLDLEAANGILQAPDFKDPVLAIMQERGLEFEKKYLDGLKGKGFSIDDNSSEEGDKGFQRTITAMQKGIDFIYQANLRYGNWQGRADLLEKVSKSSKLGDWSYEVVDSKLAKETKAGTILQICLYSKMLEAIQGVMPELMHVITPEQTFTKHSYRVDDFLAYQRFVEKRLLAMVAKGAEKIPTYPHPISHCEICRWWQNCNQKRRDDDHLSLVAGLSNMQVIEINKWNIETLKEFAKLPSPIPYKPSRGAIETYEKLKEQARVQLEARETKKPTYEFLDVIEGKGFFKLPVPSKGDVFFDLEGDPFVGTTGIEYLFGWTYDESYEKSYTGLWAFSPQEEKKAFEGFVDLIISRWKEFPDLHIYHYTAYEPSALKRLMGKYATREDEIDRMLRGGLFVDLHNVTKQAIRAGIEKYSLKEMEVFHGFERKLELREAASELRALEAILERNMVNEIPEEILKGVKEYNYEDCVSTRSLRNWLEHLLIKLTGDGNRITRPEIKTGEAGETVTEHQQRIQPLYESLAKDISLIREERDTPQQAKWLLANMLDWYRREKKAMWWEYFRLCDLPDDELLEEKAGIAGLKFTGKRRPDKKSVIDEYVFPEQECEIREGDDVKTGNGDSLGSVISINISNGSIEIKKGPSKSSIHPTSIFKLTDIKDTVKEEAIIRIASWVANFGIDATGPYRATRDLLLGYPPRTVQQFADTGSPQAVAVNWVKLLDHGVLPIQGPPGTGKSHTAAEMVLELIRSGKKVGITALSHKVIRGLFEKIIKAAQAKNVLIKGIQKVSKVSDNPNPCIIETTDNDRVLSALQTGEAQIAAGTAWLWSRDDFAESVDVLFVDEAGQLSLIDTLAVSQAAKNIVLLGDPQQLKQPQQGSHPEGTEVSALEHILKGSQTIATGEGVFLNETWRMHPTICSYISELFYEKRLTSRPNLSFQKIDGNTKFIGSGLWFEAVEHEGNQSSSIEEVNRVGEIIQELTKGDVYWIDNVGQTRTLTLNDILIIAPYNAQVGALISKLPAGSHIGTVDKFQGQEAPVVIYSMSTSSPEDAPRGMEFLYSSNRLNVAISRAKAISIIVASSKIFEPECKNPPQIKLANAFCRYLEMANS